MLASRFPYLPCWANRSYHVIARFFTVVKGFFIQKDIQNVIWVSGTGRIPDPRLLLVLQLRTKSAPVAWEAQMSKSLTCRYQLLLLYKTWLTWCCLIGWSNHSLESKSEQTCVFHLDHGRLNLCRNLLTHLDNDGRLKEKSCLKVSGLKSCESHSYFEVQLLHYQPNQASCMASLIMINKSLKDGLSVSFFMCWNWPLSKTFQVCNQCHSSARTSKDNSPEILASCYLVICVGFWRWFCMIHGQDYLSTRFLLSPWDARADPSPKQTQKMMTWRASTAKASCLLGSPSLFCNKTVLLSSDLKER